MDTRIVYNGSDQLIRLHKAGGTLRSYAEPIRLDNTRLSRPHALFSPAAQKVAYGQENKKKTAPGHEHCAKRKAVRKNVFVHNKAGGNGSKGPRLWSKDSRKKC